MKIKEIILDGFKSYGHRVKLEKFDDFFNAITGFNGTGKSNILDSICFVLGLKELKKSRVNDTTDFIYKRGQAGIKKASVSIIFNNETIPKPFGYESFEEIIVNRSIVIGGLEKYLINGQRVNRQAIDYFFQGIGLDINNPNFLIMQGKITYVSQLKPKGILNMVQETAGTKIYDIKKKESENRIKEREIKFQELNQIFNEEIRPKLKKLFRQKQEFEKYRQIKMIKFNYEQLIIGYDYMLCQKIWKINTSNIIKFKKNLLEELYEEQFILIKLHKIDFLNIKEKKQLLNQERIIKQLEANEYIMKKKINIQGNRIQIVNRTKKDLKREIKLCKMGIIKKKFKILKLDVKYVNVLFILKKIDVKEKKIKVEIEKKEDQITGIGNVVGNKGSLKDHLIVRKNELNREKLLVEDWDNELKELIYSIKKNFKKAYKKKNDWQFILLEKKKIEKKLKEIEKDIRCYSFIKFELNELCEQHEKSSDKLDRMKEDVDKIKVRKDYFYKTKIGDNFNGDKSLIYGTIAQNFKIKDQKFIKAISVAAGKSLKQIIVQNRETSKDLFKIFNERRTCVPLDDIKIRKIDYDILKSAKLIVPEVDFAINLIQYNTKFQKPIMNAFGNTLVVPNINCAKQLAFSKEIQTRCVTLDGDSVDPRGTMEGGFTRRQRDPFLNFLEWKKISSEIKKIKQKNQLIESRLKIKEEQLKKYNMLNGLIDKKRTILQGYIEQLNDSEVQYSLNENKEFYVRINFLFEKYKERKKLIKRIKNQIKTLKKRKREFKLLNEIKIKSMNQKIKEEIIKFKKIKLINKCTKNKKRIIELERINTIKIIQKNEKKIKKLTTESKKIELEIKQLHKEIIFKKKKYENIEINYKENNQEKKRKRKNFLKLKRIMFEDENKIEKLDLKINFLKYQLKEKKNQRESFKKKIEKYESKNVWIKELRRNFGKENTKFDFLKRHMIHIIKKYTRHLKKLSKLNMLVNKNVLTQFEHNNNQAKELKKKMEIVKKDKKSLEKVIFDLEEKKKRSVQIVYEKTNKNFNDIYSILLPGTKAKLIPHKGKNIDSGLEIRVAIGKEWSDSLNELSGGQKSLLALSFLLSLLRCKPAPMYILDEIDSALDLSQTQNIGIMLKKHFKESQFIIVSLKQGLFSNANVIYKTYLKYGMSQVTRSVGSRNNFYKK